MKKLILIFTKAGNKLMTPKAYVSKMITNFMYKQNKQRACRGLLARRSAQ